MSLDLSCGDLHIDPGIIFVNDQGTYFVSYAPELFLLDPIPPQELRGNLLLGLGQGENLATITDHHPIKLKQGNIILFPTTGALNRHELNTLRAD
tara:strand:- start:60 stop:344 length:285 start_codon:yes stop_codon:yes gene_type:complete